MKLTTYPSGVPVSKSWGHCDIQGLVLMIPGCQGGQCLEVYVKNGLKLLARSLNVLRVLAMD